MLGYVILPGRCASVQQGWWSYTWCNKHTVEQFHIVRQQSQRTTEGADVGLAGDSSPQQSMADVQGFIDEATEDRKKLGMEDIRGCMSMRNEQRKKGKN